MAEALVMLLKKRFLMTPLSLLVLLILEEKCEMMGI
ncbi:uncharacterized protein METZ01_LOCUS36447 [marine metagenome]|uniref:Uncharacterized protein n=1 Tax=marine metagenome TaxID=408172 RepID=A0A381R1V2_9ZZZZ